MKVFLNNQIKYNILTDYSIIDGEGGDNNNDILALVKVVVLLVVVSRPRWGPACPHNLC